MQCTVMQCSMTNQASARIMNSCICSTVLCGKYSLYVNSLMNGRIAEQPSVHIMNACIVQCCLVSIHYSLMIGHIAEQPSVRIMNACIVQCCLVSVKCNE